MPPTPRHDLLRHRLVVHGLHEPACADPADVVTALGAVQAQDYPAALWAVGLRMATPRAADVERAADEGRLLRTHILRPTWHFVSPHDIRWMLALTSPRVHALNAPGYRELELDRATLKRCRRVIVKALRRGVPLTRTDLGTELTRAGIPASGRRLAYALMHEELDGVICSGPRRGKQSTHALVDERAPAAPALRRDEALERLTRRYLSTRGPASTHDFAWWSGLTVRDAADGIALLGRDAVSQRIGDVAYWRLTDQPGDAAPRARRPRAPRAWLLPNYDEYLVAYRDRTPITGGGVSPMDALANAIVIDGRHVGWWTRTIAARSVALELSPRGRLDSRARRAVERAAANYGAFIERAVTVTTVSRPS